MLTDKIYGYIHSIESFGTLDGPGIRYVGFLQGCGLRCKFCHNPDTWQKNTGKLISTDDFFKDVLKFKKYIKKGGLTLSGGEPLLQPNFSEEIFRLCKENNIHSAIDTSGAVQIEISKKVIDKVDLVLLDLKHIDTKKCTILTGQGNENTLETLDYCQSINKKVWIRHVVVPNYSDNLSDISKMATYLSKYSVIDRVEILPFHKFGEYKWKCLGFKYDLENTPEPTRVKITQIKEIFTKNNLLVF